MENHAGTADSAARVTHGSRESILGSGAVPSTLRPWADTFANVFHVPASVSSDSASVRATFVSPEMSSAHEVFTSLRAIESLLDETKSP